MAHEVIFISQTEIPTNFLFIMEYMTRNHAWGLLGARDMATVVKSLFCKEDRWAYRNIRKERKQVYHMLFRKYKKDRSRLWSNLILR